MANPHSQPTIALLHWGDRIEDFLDTINVSFDAFCNELTGGWMFGYVEALRQAGVRTVLFCISNRVTTPERYIHKPTGATICVLPAPKIHSYMRRPMRYPYGWTLDEVFGKTDRIRHPFYRPLYAALKDITPYCATPFIALARELRREHCQAILCQEYEYARFDVCVLLGQMLRLPVFATFQGGDFQLSRLERPLRPLALHLCAGLIVATQTEIDRVQTKYGIPSAKIAKIFNPMDFTNWRIMSRQDARIQLGIPLTAKVIIYHGRIELYRKGLDVLMDAWEILCRDRPTLDARLLLVGTGSDAKQLHQLIATKQLPGIIWRDEYVRDRALIQQYLSAADLYTLPSRHEGFPVAPIEAMACSLPVVATNAPGVPDILDGEAASGGLIVPCGDAIALASAITQVLENDELRHQLSVRAQHRAKTGFSLEFIGKQLREFLLSTSESGS